MIRNAPAWCRELGENLSDHNGPTRSYFLKSMLPFLRWWPRVNRQTLRADLIAGLTGGLILVPQGVAFATIAGMPPEYGLYAAMWPAIVAASALALVFTVGAPHSSWNPLWVLVPLLDCRVPPVKLMPPDNVFQIWP